MITFTVRILWIVNNDREECWSVLLWKTILAKVLWKVRSLIMTNEGYKYLKPLIFVYGTLRFSYQHPLAHQLRSEASYLGQFYFQGRLYQIENYPGAITSDDPEDQICGDLYQLNHKGLLADLDQYEECGEGFSQPTEYLRTRKDIYRLEDIKAKKNPFWAWVYLYNHPISHQGLIQSGDFLEYIQNP